MKVLVLTIFCLAGGILANPAPSDEANINDLEEVYKNHGDTAEGLLVMDREEDTSEKVIIQSEKHDLDDKFNIKQFLPKEGIDSFDLLEKLGLDAKVLEKLTRAYLKLYNFLLMLGLTQQSDPNIRLPKHIKNRCFRPSEELQNSELPQIWREDLEMIKSLHFNSKPYNELKEALEQVYSFLKLKGINLQVGSLVGRDIECTAIRSAGTRLDLPESWIKTLKDLKILGMSSQALDEITRVCNELYNFYMKKGLMFGSNLILPAYIEVDCFKPSQSYNRADLPEIWSLDLKIMKSLGMDVKLFSEVEKSLKNIYALLKSKGLTHIKMNSMLQLEKCSERHITKRSVQIEKPQLTELKGDFLSCLITLITDCLACKGDTTCIVKALTNFVSCISKKPESTFF